MAIGLLLLLGFCAFACRTRLCRRRRHQDAHIAAGHNSSRAPLTHSPALCLQPPGLSTSHCRGICSALPNPLSSSGGACQGYPISGRRYGEWNSAWQVMQVTAIGRTSKLFISTSTSRLLFRMTLGTRQSVAKTTTQHLLAQQYRHKRGLRRLRSRQRSGRSCNGSCGGQQLQQLPNQAPVKRPRLLERLHSSSR